MLEQVFGQIYLDENELLLGHLTLTKPAHLHLFSFGNKYATSNHELGRFLQKLMYDQQHEYLYYASRFYEMPILVLDQHHLALSKEDLLQLLNMRRALMTSLDSAFNVMKKYPGLWSKEETQLLSTWQHNPSFLDIRTLDGRIDHGELTRLERYWLELGLPINNPRQNGQEQLKQRLFNLAALFETDRFQESWKLHQYLLEKYHAEVIKDPHEKWAGMMTIMPTTTDAETIEAILYRDHHIVDRPRVDFSIPKLTASWARELLSFYTAYQGIDVNEPGRLKRVHQTLRSFHPPVITNPDASCLALLPSENGLHGITVNSDKFMQTKKWQNAADFAKTCYAKKIYKIEAPMLYQQVLVKMDVFDQHAQAIVEEMIQSVLQDKKQTLTSLANYRLLHALKGAGETSFDNHLKQANTILSMYLTVQLKMIELVQNLLQEGISVLSVNSLILYVTLPEGMNEAKLKKILADSPFAVVDSGRDFYAKSSNNHLYYSNQNGIQTAGDGVNHYDGPNVYTDQQRPTIVEKVLDDLLLQAQGDFATITLKKIISTLQDHLYHFDPKLWMQPLLSSPLKEIFALDLKNKRLAEPALRGFYVKNGTKDGTQVERIYYSNRGQGDDSLNELADEINLRERYQVSKKRVFLENNSLYQGHIFLIVDDLKNLPPDLRKQLDLDAYAEQVMQLLNTWQNKK